jgi:hypothetical protein
MMPNKFAESKFFHIATLYCGLYKNKMKRDCFCILLTYVPIHRTYACIVYGTLHACGAHVSIATGTITYK